MKVHQADLLVIGIARLCTRRMSRPPSAKILMIPVVSGSGGEEVVPHLQRDHQLKLGFAPPAAGSCPLLEEAVDQ